MNIGYSNLIIKVGIRIKINVVKRLGAMHIAA